MLSNVANARSSKTFAALALRCRRRSSGVYFKMGTQQNTRAAVILTANYSASNSAGDNNRSFSPAIAAYLSLHLATTIPNATEKQRTYLFSKMIHIMEAVYGKNQVKVSHLQSFGAAGLQALAASILHEEETKKSSVTEQFVTVRFTVPHHKTEFDLKWHYATIQPTLLHVAESPEGAELLSEYIEGACGGHASCCTCHVYVDNSATDSSESFKLSEALESELDMLDLAYQPTVQSRLACQVRLLQVPVQHDPDKPLLRVMIPPGVNNVWN
jgi:ferredoxin